MYIPIVRGCHVNAYIVQQALKIHFNCILLTCTHVHVFTNNKKGV